MAARSPAMLVAEERSMNLAALQQRDPYITGIADSASQVDRDWLIIASLGLVGNW